MLQFNNIYSCCLHERQFAKVNDGLTAVVFFVAVVPHTGRAPTNLKQVLFLHIKLCRVERNEVQSKHPPERYHINAFRIYSGTAIKAFALGEKVSRSDG